MPYATIHPDHEAAKLALKTPLRAVVRDSSEGELKGEQLNPIELARLAYFAGPLWKDASALAMAVMVSLSESQGYTEAHCDNYKDQKDGSRTLLSKDVGPWQINILAADLGSKYERDLYDPKKNAKAAYALYERRGWQPWVAYNTRVCYHAAYLQRGCLAVMNFLAEARVAEAAKFGIDAETEIPVFAIKQLPYTKRKKG